MSDYDVTASDVQEAVRFLQAVLEVQQPTVDWAPGSPDHEVLVKGAATPVAVLRKSIEVLRRNHSLLDLRLATDSVDVADRADALLANLLLRRDAGAFARGVGLVKFSTRVDQRVPRTARFFRDATHVFYPDYADDVVVAAGDLRPVRGPGGVVAYYAAPLGLKAARTGADYNFAAGPFVDVDRFSPHLLGAEHLAPLTDGANVQGTSDFIDAASDALALRALGAARSNSVVLRTTFGITQTRTLGHGDPEMARDRMSGVHLGGCADLYVRQPLREVVTQLEVGADFPRHDGRVVIFRDSTAPFGTTLPGDILSVTAGLTEAPITYAIRAVRSASELEIDVRTPFSEATDEALAPVPLTYSVGNNWPAFTNRVGVTTTATAATSRALATPNRVLLPGGPVYAVSRVELLAPPAALVAYVDPLTGRVPFNVRANLTAAPPTAATTGLTYRVEVLNPTEAQSSRALTQVEVGWPALSLDGYTLEVTYATLAGFDTVAAFVEGPGDRPPAGDYLVRALHPVYLAATIPYALRATSGGAFDPTTAARTLANFVIAHREVDPLDVSTLVTQLRFDADAAVATVYAFTIAYELLAPDGRVYRYTTTDKVTLFPDSTSGATLTNPLEVGLPAIGYETALRRTLLQQGVSNRTVRFLVADGAVVLTARS